MTIHPIAALSFASLLVFSLSACEAVKSTLTDWDQAISGSVNGEPPAQPAQRLAQPAAPAKPAPSRPARKAAPKATAKNADKPAAQPADKVEDKAEDKPADNQSAATSVAALPPAPQATGPVRLIGLSTGETSALLGRPESEREASPGKIWHYSSGPCSVDVHFFFDVSRNDFYALDYKAKGDDADACLNRLRKPAAKS